jgi:cytochrome b subunit of formate dehydrogenase
VLGFVGLFFKVWRDNIWERRDTEWMKARRI